MKCLDCNYGCGTPHNLLFHYKLKHKDKVSRCTCGNQTIRGNCVGKVISSKIRGTASKYSSSSSSSSSNFSSIFGSISSSNSIFDYNLRSSFTESNCNSNSNYNSNSDSDSDSNSNSNSNLRSKWGTKGESPLACHGQSPFTDSNSDSNSNMQSNCRANGESPHIETDITKKTCNRYRVIKQITCFDKKEVNM